MKKTCLYIFLLFLFFVQADFHSETEGFSLLNKTFAAEEKDEATENKMKLIKNLNSLLVESYKTKLDQILDNLNENIKNQSKEDKIKTLTTILIPINSRIKLIESKTNISQNRKEVLLEVLYYIKKSLEDEINRLLDKKINL